MMSAERKVLSAEQETLSGVARRKVFPFLHSGLSTQYSALLALFLLLPLVAHADEPLSPPQNVRVLDTPNDGGGSLTVLWDRASGESKDRRYQILLQQPNGAEPKALAEFASDTHYVKDARIAWWTQPAPGDAHLFTIKSGRGLELKDGVSYGVTVVAVSNEQKVTATSVQAMPEPNWFNWNQINNLAIVIIFGLIVLGSIQIAKKKDIFLRRIAGLDAVDEAIGRATELGKPILYLTGAGDMSEPSTVAAAVILGRVARRVASYETDLMVPHRDPIVMAVCQEITKQSYLEAGKPDVFKEDSNFFITTDQFSYTAAVDGIMLRKKPAANFFMGSYFAESLLLTETGASTGAIQIAGTDSDHQLPFFVTTCDYTLIGEELYAASAYLSREPIQVGTLRGQDIGKACILGTIGVGAAAATAAILFGVDLSPIIDLMRDLK
jgi:hypothetical protein